MRTGYSNGDYRCFTVVTARYGWHTVKARRPMFGCNLLFVNMGLMGDS